MPIRVLFTSLKHKLSVVQSSSKNLDLSRLLLRVISCESVIEMCRAGLANQRPENRWATNERRNKAGCLSLWLYKILWEVAILILHCTFSRARAYRFSLLLSSSAERNEKNHSPLSPTITCHVTMSVPITITTRVNAGTGRARVVSVYVLTPPVSIVSHFDEFGNNQWLGRTPGITTLTSAPRDMRGCGASELRRSSVNIFIIIGHLTNNDHYWISEFSDREKSHDLKFIRHSARSGRRDSFVLAWKLFILKLVTHH